MSPQSTLPATAAAKDYLRIKELLCELADLTPAEREPRARSLLQNEPVLLERILNLLRGLQQEETFLEQDLPGLVGLEALRMESADTDDKDRMPGASIGHFRILDRLGEGGMAVVYRARQTEPIERQVALKVISAHATSVQRTRFERECSTLARFSHPNVAVMYESGVSPAGEPYVAMELVEGLPISDWCRLHKVPLPQRIQLFVEACQGLTHAHGKGILHRDIKPSNLLVTEVDGKAMVKVIDFGIAAALTPGIDQLANITGQQLIGTPAYMSPESVLIHDRQSLDARSDVYSLGVVLFELLCGKRPYDAFDLPLADWLGMLSTRSAPHMRQVFRQLSSEEQQNIAEHAQTGPKRLARVLTSDLDAIVSKALELEPERRYASSNELALDLRRYLIGSAVSAHAPRRIYLARKFLRRHWVGASVAILLLLTLAGGIIARELEVRQTRLALEESQAISDFLVDLLEHASPLRTSGEEVTLQDIIDNGTDELSDRFADKPLVKARLLHTLGRVYGERGEYLKGSTLLEQSLALLDRAGSDDLDERIRVLSDLGVALRRQGRLDESESVLLRAQSLTSEMEPQDPLLNADVANSLGNFYVLSESWEKAEKQHLLALQLREANLPAGDLQITASRNNVATVLINSWQLERALPYAQRTFEEWQHNLPPEHPWISVARNNLAVALERLGRREESLRLSMDALAEAQQRLGPDHPDISDLWRNLSVVLGEFGRHDEAVDAMQQHVRILAESLGPDAPRTLGAERRLVNLSFLEQDYEQTLAGLDSILERLKKVEPDSSLEAALNLDRANTLIELGRYEEAADTLGSLAGLSIGNQYRLRRLRAKLMGEMGHPEQAIAELLSLQEETSASLPQYNQNHGYILNSLAREALAAGDLVRALSWAKENLQFWQKVNQTLSIYMATELLGKVYLANGETGAGLELLEQAVAGYRSHLPVMHPIILEAEANLAASRP